MAVRALAYPAVVAISSDAVAGFVGVVTGSVITGGVQFTLAIRADRRRGRVARRLLASELGLMYTAVDTGALMGRWDWVKRFETAEHNAHREEFAFDKSKTWQAVETAYATFTSVASLAAITPEVPSVTLLRMAEVALSAIEDALRQLRHPNLPKRSSQPNEDGHD